MTDASIGRALAAVPDPMLLLDAAGRVTTANDAALEFFGDWIVGRNQAAVLRQPALQALIEQAYATGRDGQTEYSVSGMAGESVYRVRVVALEQGAVPVGGLIIHFDDISHLQEAAEMRRGFVANVSHELRTPLTAIMGFIETLRGPARNDPEAQERFLTIMEDEARRMNRIVSDLLSLSRVEAQERMRPDAIVDLNAVIDAAVATLREQAERSGNQLEIARPKGSLEVRGDIDQLTQVFLNLLENAIKYGRPERPVRIVVTETTGTGAMTGPVLQIDVIDEGEGLDERHLPRLTERFYRVDSHRSRAMGGTGLGLAIVKHIVNRHRGRLRITSKKGQGSTFSVLLPRA